jgi:ribose 5-phosphate isomerase B
MKIAIGADQAGFKYKEVIKKFLIEKGHTVDDFGTDSEKPCDYPDIMRPVAKAVAAGKYDRGIILGGSGNGEAMVANRVKGVRCALCWDLRSARLRKPSKSLNFGSIPHSTADDTSPASKKSTRNKARFS